MNFKEKIINAIYAQCAMDSIGNPFEFQYGINPDDVIKYANEAKTLVISDDSQMGPLFGFEAINNLSNYSGDIFGQVQKSFTRSYLDWYYTQTNDKYNKLTSNGLLGFDSMYSVQAPGNTCLSALESISNNKPVVNQSMGCGSVMRLLPLVYLFDEKFDLEYSEVIECAKITGEITHKHFANEAAIAKYMFVAYCIINELPIDCPDVGHISELGEGWIAPEAVDMAIWAYCHAKSFDELLMLSIGHDGDSDSVGSMSGVLYGLSGREVPQKYVAKLDALDAIEYIISTIK